MESCFNDASEGVRFRSTAELNWRWFRQSIDINTTWGLVTWPSHPTNTVTGTRARINVSRGVQYRDQ